jgi:hypothetical protein
MNARLVFAAVGFAWFAACVSAMTLDEFAETTQRVIASGSFDGFQSTVIYPARRHIKGFDSFPPDLPDAESRILRWAAEGTAKDEEFLVQNRSKALQDHSLRRRAADRFEDLCSALSFCHAKRLTRRWSQPRTVRMPRCLCF